MNLKNFRLNIIIRVLLIMVLSLVLAFVLIKTEWLFTPIVIGILLISVATSLTWYVEKTNSDLTQFLLSIKQGSFTNIFKGTGKGSNQAQLSQAFNAVIEEFQKISIEKESQYQYLRTLNENIGISIISYTGDGEIELINPAAKNLLKKPYLKNIKDIEAIDPALHKAIVTLHSGERQVIKAYIKDEIIQLSLHVKDFILQNKSFRLVLLQNIHIELEQKEVEAWQKLISVLTHEIMNSVTPIVSLSSAINQMLHNEDLSKLPADDQEDIITSLQTIENRSKGLLKFVNAYKDFSKTPELKITDVNIVSMIERLTSLLKPDLEKSNIRLVMDIKARELKVKADHELLEQVLINLIKNAIEALDGAENGEISIAVRRAGARKIAMTIEDNGPGMSKETIDRIFTPFYTTKKKGTGIGLSFARQIMKLHNGSVTVQSELKKGTVFHLEF
ncbi:sensor histidine kinase [Fulvivirga kasyanovii]|uniref:histidine kinase n=1 Tax=Fulvivirga kasyanovii TaxID=396812 RepID=A0ABW9RYI2_9BACT|nr:ATP-binding protein [Fulvivirga kasyanovii]MTI29053.1 GHKL domain-containing protein [Fulvivirga kasyanovii]